MTDLPLNNTMKATLNNFRAEKSSFKLLIPTFKTLEFVDVADIISIQAAESYSRIVIEGNITYLSTQGFGKLSEMLLQYHFFQCHKSHLINLKKIKRYHKDGQVELNNGNKIPVARRRKEVFLDTILSPIF